MFRVTCVVFVSLLVSNSFGDSLIATIPEKESKPGPHESSGGGKVGAPDGKNAPRELSEGELEKFRRRVTEMWEQKGYARNEEPGERPVQMNNALAHAIRDAHEGKPKELNTMLDELRAQITDKKECEDFFSNFRQAYLKSENYAKARTVLDLRAVPTLELQERIKKNDKAAREEYDRRVGAIVSAGNGIWSERQSSNLLYAYSLAKKDEAAQKSNGSEVKADARIEYMLGYLQPGVEKDNQVRFVEQLSKKDSLPCGEDLSKDMSDVMKVLRGKQADASSITNKTDQRFGKKSELEFLTKEWQEAKRAANSVPEEVKAAMERRLANQQVAVPKSFQNSINNVIDMDGLKYDQMKEANRDAMFKWFADGGSNRFYRPTLNEYIAKLDSQFKKKGRTVKNTMTEAETELSSTLDLLAAVDPITGARSLKVNGEKVDLAPPFDRFGDKPAESDIPHIQKIDWAKDKLSIPAYGLTRRPPDTAEQNMKLFAMQMASAQDMPEDAQKNFMAQIRSDWAAKEDFYKQTYGTPPAGMFPKVPTYLSPQEVQAEAQSSRIQALEKQLAQEQAEKAATNARLERLERLLQNQKP